MSKPGDQLQPLDQLSFHRQKWQTQNVFKEGTDFAGMQLHPKLAATMHGVLPESNFSRISKSTKDAKGDTIVFIGLASLPAFLFRLLFSLVF